MFDRICNSFGLNRYTVETPVSQHQQSANKRDSGVRPTALPPRATPPNDTELGPRTGVPAAGASPSASPLAAVTPSPTRSETALVATHADSAEADMAVASHPLIDAMKHGSANLHGLVENQFGRAAEVMFSKAMLRQALQALGPLTASAAPVGLPGMPAVLIAQSLALATGADATRSLAALGALRRLDPVGEVAAAWQHREAPVTRPDEADAWRVVMELGNTPSGIKVLQAVLGKPVAPADESDFALLLKTALAITERDALLTTPSAMLAGPSAPTALLGDALDSAAASLAGNVEAAQMNAWALNAVRNDMFDTGPGTLFAALNARIMKMGQWIRHAAGDTALQLRNPIKGKSAFRALRHGAQQVDRGTAIGRHRTAFDVALRKAATELRAQLVQLAPLARAGGPAQVPQELFRAAVIDHCLATGAGTPLDGMHFNAAAMDDIAARLAGLLAEAGGRPQGAHPPGLLAQLKSLPQFEALGSTPMSMEQLGTWFGDALKRHESLPWAGAEARPRWADAVAGALKKAHQEVHGHDTRLPQVSREGMRGALKHIVANIEGSSRLRLSSGGIVGVGTRNLTAAVSSLVTGFLLRGRVDARKQWGRHAVFEIAMPPYDMEVMIATQRQRAVQFGMGASVGPDLAVVKAGGNVDVTAYGSESADLKGVTLRLPRIGRPVSALRTEFAQLVDKLLDGTAAEAGQAQEPLLKQLLQDFPKLTVNHIGEAGDERKRHGVTAEGVAAVQGFGMRAGVSAGAAIEAQRGVIRHYEDASGSMQVERHIAGWGVRGGLGARLAAGPSVDAGPVKLSSGNTDTVIAGISADLFVTGSAERREAVYQDGRLHPISFKETEHQNLDSFLADVEARRNEWVQARLNSPGTSRAAGTEHTTLQRFLDDVAEYNKPTHTFAFRSTIRPEAAERIDAYRSTERLAQRMLDQAARAGANGDSAFPVPTGSPQAAINASKQAVEDEWSNPASVQPYSLRAYERVSAQSTLGLNLIAQFSSQHAADASHIDNRLDVA
jgi:hypothetical protein